MNELVLKKYRVLKKKRMSRRKILALTVPLIVLSMILSVVYLLPSNSVKAVDDYTFGSETVNKGTSTSPTERNTENDLYNSLQEADQYPDTNFSGSSENVVTGTPGGGAFPGSLDTDDATRRSYAEAAGGAGSPVIQVLRPTSDGDIVTMVEYPTDPATHWDKVDETDVGGDGDSTYLEGVATNHESELGMADLSDPGGSYDINVEMWHISRGESTSKCTVVWGVEIGGVGYEGGSTDMTSISYANFSYEWTVRPSDSQEWTLSDVDGLECYIRASDANPDTRTTQVGLVITITPTGTYTLDAQITYSSVTTTSQTTGYKVLCQGYRSAAENFLVNAWDYVALGWNLKATINSASDTDFDFTLTADEYDSGGSEIKLQIKDADADGIQDTVYFDVLKVNRIEVGYALDVDMSSTAVAEYGNLTLRIKGYTSTEQFNVNVWNYTSSAYDTGKLAITSLSNAWQTTVDLCEAHHRLGTTVKIQFTDETDATADTVADIFYLDVAWVTRYHVDPVLALYGADPQIIGEGLPLAFFANYSDYDNEAPSFMYVNIDTSDYSLSKNDSGDVSYHNGVNYSLSKSDLTLGEHTYYFRTQDANSGVITTASAKVYVNDTPILSGDTVIPATGNVGQSFRFEVVFTDADGDLPVYIKARIDSTDYDCSEDSPGDVDTSDGKLYYYDKVMSGGDHPYQFKAKDAYNAEVLSSEKNLHVNNIPALSGYGRTPGDPVYVTTKLNFTVTFTDADNELPSAMKWRENGGAVQNLSMTQIDPYDVTTSDGKTYFFWVYLNHGSHNYDYWASDGSVGTDGGSNSITIQNRAPTIDNKIVDDHEWRNTYWSWDYAYTDLDGDTVVFEMSTNGTFLNINSASGLVDGTTSDPVGWYETTVWCNDSYSGTDSDSFILYVDNREPVITNGPGAHVDQYRNQAWYYDFDATDADTDTLYWESSGPAWLTINSGTGNLSGTTSDTPGLYSFTVYANDSHTGSDNYPFEIEITNRDPVITNGPGASVNEWRNTAWEYDFDGTDADTDTISWGRSGVTWLTMNSGSGLLSGTTTDTPGDYPITVYANDSYGGQDTYVFTQHILNRAPTITNGPGADPNEYRNTFWSYDFDYNDLDGDTIGWESSGPAWLTIVSGTGVLSGTTTDTPGAYGFTVYANDSYGGSANYPFTLHINNQVPVITSAGNTTQESGTYLAYLVTATDGDSDALTCELSTNASWLSVSNFWVNGTATGIGWYACTIWVNDSYGGSDSDYWEVTVWGGANQPPSFTSAAKDSVGHPVDYYYDCNASDPEVDPLYFDMTSTHPNLVIDHDTGEVTGYIATAGTWWVNISVTDGEFTVWQNFTLETTNTIPSFTSVPIENVGHPVDYYFDSNATDADGDTLVYGLSGNCTSMLGIDTATGEVSGHISLPGWWYVNISASDPNSTVWQNFTLTASNTPPAFDSSPTTTWQHGTSYSYDANAHDADGDSYSFGLQGNCTTFLSIIPATGVVSGVVPTVGWWYLNVSVSDAWSTTWQNYILTGLNTAPSFTSSGITEWQNGTLYYYDANANDANSDGLTFYLEGNCTVYFSIDPGTGEVSGTILHMGWWYANISVNDTWSIVWQNYTVYSLNTPPSITTSPGLTGTPGVAYFYDADATDLNGDTLEWAATEKPVWMIVDPTNGQCTGIPVIAGNYDVKLVAWDGLAYAYQNWTITVSEESEEPPSNPPISPPNPGDSPQAKFSYLVQGNRVALVDISFGNIQKRQWDFGDGFGDTRARVIHQYSQPGTYIITLTVWDELGHISFATWGVEIGSGPEYAIQKGETGIMIVTPAGTLELNAVLCIMLGVLATIMSFSSRKIPLLTPKRMQIIAAILLILGLGFYVF